MAQERPMARISIAPDVVSTQESMHQKHRVSTSAEALDGNHITSPVSLFSRMSSRGSSSFGWCKDFDATTDDLLPTVSDKVVVLMGQTGSGKSTFINCAAGHDVAPVTHSVTSCTNDIRLFHCARPGHPNERIFLVDTPGFDHTKAQSPKGVLQQVSEWLIATYKRDVKVAGILQLVDITQAQVTSSHRLALKAFSELCGADFLCNVVVVSTFWEDLDSLQVGTMREHELRKLLAKDYDFNDIRYSRFPERTKQAAWDVIDLLQGPERVLRIQSEVVDQRRSLEESSAFRSLRKVWNRLKLTYAV